MKYALIAMLAATSFGVAAQNVTVENRQLGSGTPGEKNAEQTTIVNDMRHGPQYLPGYPTAATIWPRVVDVPCDRVGNDLICDGFNWSPSMGPGEYLYINPVMRPAPQVVEKVVPVPVPVEKIVIKEVPAKKVRE